MEYVDELEKQIDLLKTENFDLSESNHKLRKDNKQNNSEDLTLKCSELISTNRLLAAEFENIYYFVQELIKTMKKNKEANLKQSLSLL